MSRSFSPDNKVLRLKLFIVGGIILVLFMVFILYLFNLQIVENIIWEDRAQAVSRRSEPLPAQRGLIWDRNYNMPLATNIDSFAIHAVPAEISPLNPESLSNRLSQLLEIDSESIINRFPADWKNSWNPVEILDGVAFESIVRIAESVENYPGIHWQSKPYRWYNEVGAFSHVLGYVGNISTDELQILYNMGYVNTASLGKSGIEKTFDGVLRGKDGKIFRTVDVKGKQLNSEDEDFIPPESGNDIVLTIDRRIQVLAEKALGPRKGAVVVLKPTTGEILAMVSYPSYDPNMFAKSNPGSFSNLSMNDDFPFLNRALQSGYAPASTFKLIMSAAALGENKVSLNRHINCRGHMTLNDRVFWCHKRSGHGYVNLEDAIAHSCNIYFGTIGVEVLGIELISRYARAFGLGSLTGIELDGDIAGNVPDKTWKENIYNIKWTTGDTLNSSIGQGFLLVTPLQMANVTAGIVNNGIIYRPFLLKEVRKSGTGVVVDRKEPEILHTIDLLEDSDYRFIKKAMRSVITQGTGKWAVHTKSVKIAGKTGTGEVGLEDRWHDWFVAYGPYQTHDPDERIVVVSLIEASDSYDWWAPKATDIIFEGVFGNKTYESVVSEWKRRKVWWTTQIKTLPKPGWPYTPESGKK